MNQETLKDALGRPIGRINTESNGVQKITDALGRQCGSYDPKQNVTKDVLGRPVGKGNLLTRLLV